jgi:two-component system, OmpR family, response regulator
MRVLIAEDESTVSSAVARAVAQAGFVPDVIGNGDEAWFKGSTEDYAAIILDLGLPGLDGLSVLRRWRAEGLKTPIIILSARGTWAERVDGIDNGADDYLPKPFEMEELLARLRSILRRAGGLASSILEVGALRLDLKAGKLTLAGKLMDLTPLEFRLMHHLALHQDEQVSKEDLAEKLYAVNHERDPNAVEALVSRLRRKLGVNVIESKRGFGYRLHVADR